jgi:predicted DNA-binding transcriptional regulator AlpA
MDGRCISQNELAQRWQFSESTLERWRSQRTGPVFLRLGGQVRYRVTDVEAFETQAMGMASGQMSDKMANELRFRKPITPKNARQVRTS